MNLRFVSCWLLLASLILSVTGCGPSKPEDINPKPNEKETTNTTSEVTSAPATPSASESTAKEEVLLQPFAPPPLAELDAKAEWIDRPVKDSLAMLREYQASEKPLATAAEALALKNDSEAANAKIKSALGRLPENASDVNWDATFNRHTRGDVKSTNPILLNATVEFEVIGLTGFGLFSFDWNMQPFANKETAKSWQTSKDRMLDKVIMRNDLTWSDGKPITAHDVVFTFQTIMNPKVPVPAVRSGTDQLRWVEAYDDYTLVFFHKEALPTNVWNINFPVIPKHIYEKSMHDDYTLADSAYHVKYENNPVCGGPYEIVKRVRGQEILLRRRESWYLHNGQEVREKPYFKEIRFRILSDTNTSLLALKSGEIDDLELNPEQWQTQTADEDFYRQNTKSKALEWVYFYFGWNCKSPFFSDVRVRRAMSYAFNHKEMLEKLCYNLFQPCNGIYHETAWMAPKNPPKPYQQDLDKAEELLDEAGWIDHDGDGIRDKMIGGKLVPFDFGILVSQAKLRVDICSLLKENLAQIGINCTVRQMEPTVLQEKMLKHEYEAMFSGWGTGTDPDTADNLFMTGEMRNFGEYSNPEIDKLYKEGKREFDPEKRAAIYGRIHTLLYDDQPYTWLYFQNAFYGFNRELRGYNYSPRGPFTYSPGFFSIWRVIP